MRIHELRDKTGQLYAFEISSLVTRRGARRIAARIPGVRFLSLPSKRRDREEGVFCIFEIHGVHFQLWEPFNDNSRFWVGPQPVQSTPVLDIVRVAFAEANAVRAFFALAG